MICDRSWSGVDMQLGMRSGPRPFTPLCRALLGVDCKGGLKLHHSLKDFLPIARTVEQDRKTPELL